MVIKMKLSNATLTQLEQKVGRPTYPRGHLKQGIVHIGVGGFHRAHQAVYTERLLQAGGSEDWAICGLGLREADRAMQQVLSDQDYLYTLVELGTEGSKEVSVIGAITGFLFAPDNPAAVLEKLADPDVRIVSLTITEGGYNVDDNTGLFNKQHADIVHDLANPQRPRTVFGYLVEALAQRRARGTAPFTILSCDNLPHNGDVARKAILAYAALREPELCAWIEAQVSFPNSMVDRITPVTTPEQILLLNEEYGIEDRWPVVCEPFIQWVLEDNFCNGRPQWERVGVQFTQDVAPYETMKLRLLNAGHSAMAYLGYLAGYRYTHEVMADPCFALFIRDFMDKDVTPVLGEIAGIDIEAYKQTLIERFSNPQIADQLARLCLDGSSKFPKFLIPTIQQLLDERRDLERVALIIASWALYLRGRDESGQPHEIQDPMAQRLQQAVSNRERLTQDFLSLEDLFGTELLDSAGFVRAFDRAVDQLESRGVLSVLESLKTV